MTAPMSPAPPDAVTAKVNRLLADAFNRARHIQQCQLCGLRGPSVDPGCQGECEAEE